MDSHHHHHQQQLAQHPPPQHLHQQQQQHHHHQQQQQQQQPFDRETPWRSFCFTAPKMLPILPASLPDAPPTDTSNFVMIIYTGLSIPPDPTPPLEAAAAARTLHAMGAFGPPTPQQQAPVSTPPSAHVQPQLQQHHPNPTANTNPQQPQNQPHIHHHPPVLQRDHHLQRDIHREDILAIDGFRDGITQQQQQQLAVGMHVQVPFVKGVRLRQQPPPPHMRLPVPVSLHAQNTNPHINPNPHQPLSRDHQEYREPPPPPPPPITPITPTTPATPTFPPSSPDNQNSSSSAREHTCSFPGCGKTFDRRYNLTVHYRRHTNEMPYPCKQPGCPQKFKWRSSQSHHMKTRHQLDSKIAKKPRPPPVRTLRYPKKQDEEDTNDADKKLRTSFSPKKRRLQQ